MNIDPSQLSSGVAVLNNAMHNQLVIVENASFVAQLTHRGALVLVGNAAVTFPSDAAVPFAIGDFINFSASASTPCTFVAGSGATVNSTGSALSAQYAAATAWKTSSNTWLIVGSFA